jgi:hypothetical protein
VDPLVSGQSVDAFMGFIQSPAGFQGGGGGFGGGGGRGAMAFRNNSLGAQAVASNFDFVSAGANTAMSPFAGQQIEDLFFYRQGGVTLHKGDRANYVLFKTDAPYKEVYTWDNQNPIVNNVDYRPAPQEPQPPEDVWHTLQFKNTSGRPLTTAPATTFKNGQILGQDTMNYVSTGGDVEIKITKALDIKAESSEEEVSRDRGAIKGDNGVPLFDLVTLKGTLQAANLKGEAVTLRIRRDFTGDLVAAEGDPDVKKTTKGLRDTNSTGRLTWTKTVEPGHPLRLAYTYKVYVRAQ